MACLRSTDNNCPLTDFSHFASENFSERLHSIIFLYTLSVFLTILFVILYFSHRKLFQTFFAWLCELQINERHYRNK